MARRPIIATLACALLVGVAGVGRAQFGNPPGQGGPFGGMPGPPPGMPGGPMGIPGPMSPEMARRVDAIRVLQKLVQMRMGRKEITAALPPLHALLDAERAAQARSVEALEQQRKALLAAETPDDIPAPPTEKLRQQAQELREEQQKRWAEIAKALGGQRAAELQQMLNPFRFGPMWPGGMGWPGFGAPRPNAPGGFGAAPPAAGDQRPRTDALHGVSPSSIMDVPYVSLPDLISLLEQRLAALKP